MSEPQSDGIFTSSPETGLPGGGVGSLCSGKP
jgi:hypothetical protein